MPSYAFSFTETNVIEIRGVTHGLRSADLVVMIWEMLDGSRRQLVAPGHVEVNDVSLDITILLMQPMSGRGVLLA